MSFLDYVHRARAGVSSYLTPSPSSRSDGLPFLSGSSIASSSTPQPIRTPQSVSGELPTIKLPSYNEFIAHLDNVDMDRNVDRFKSFERPSFSVASGAWADPRATPAHCTPCYSYCPPQCQLPPLNHILSDVLRPSSATHHCYYICCTCQPHHPSAPSNDYQACYDCTPSSTSLRTVSPAQTSNHNHQPTAPHTNIHCHPSANPTVSSSSKLFEHSAESDSFSPVTSKPKPARRVRREHPMSKSRQTFQATLRTTLKPARPKSAKSSSSGTPKSKRLPAHPMPFFATLFPKGVRNYTGEPGDEGDDRANYFSDAELMEMMPSGYQRWQDAINRYKAPAHTEKDLEDLVHALAEGTCKDEDLGLDVVDAMDASSKKGCDNDESWKRFVQIAPGQFGNNGEQLYICKLRKKGGCELCGYPQSKQAVKRHVNDVHLGLRPWACPFKDCHKRFKQRMNLTIHSFACHTRQTPFHCSHCDAQFSDPAVRHEHCQKHHPGTVKPRKKKAYSITFNEDEVMDVDDD